MVLIGSHSSLHVRFAVKLKGEVEQASKQPSFNDFFSSPVLIRSLNFLQFISQSTTTGEHQVLIKHYFYTSVVVLTI